MSEGENKKLKKEKKELVTNLASHYSRILYNFLTHYIFTCIYYLNYLFTLQKRGALVSFSLIGWGQGRGCLGACDWLNLLFTWQRDEPRAHSALCWGKKLSMFQMSSVCFVCVCVADVQRALMRWILNRGMRCHVTAKKIKRTPSGEKEWSPLHLQKILWVILSSDCTSEFGVAYILH